MNNKTILVVDDEPHILELVKLYLSNEGFCVECANSGPLALEKFRTVAPSLIVLDLMLPELDGWEVCRQLRRESHVPIIMLTARSDDIDKIVGLEIGADDYLTKPFNPRELVARVKALLRRSSIEPMPSGADASNAAVIEVGNTLVDIEKHEVRINGFLVELRAKEFDLLVAFARHVGAVFERDKLLNTVWGYEYFGDTRTVDVHVAHLRERLAGSSLMIQTIRGLGYKAVLT
jgi:two-component system, OmpR family, alkaline phosphatase synthesis response regulator PhoP